VARAHRPPTADRVRQAALFAGSVSGVTAVLGAATVGVLLGQAHQARRVIPMAEAPPPRGDGLYGPRFPGRPLEFVILGDSSAAGYGVHRPRETPGVLLATAVSRRLRRPVRLHRLAVVGSTSAGLPHQVEAAAELHPDVALIVVGGNDVTHAASRRAAVAYLAEAVRRLQAVGAEVVVGTCPDLGAIRPIKPPLRWLARHWSRQLAAAQTVAVVEAGGRTVSLGEVMAARMAAEPGRMFSADQFHPSAEGYARAAAGMLPAVLAAFAAAAGRPPVTPPAVAADDGLRTLTQAAREAVRSPGTEVTGARVDGRERGPAGRWAVLRHNPWFDQLPWVANRTASAVVGADTGGGPPTETEPTDLAVPPNDRAATAGDDRSTA
jgi:lysophospholipase L1-like esterase